jgi:hypothetical protein
VEPLKGGASWENFRSLRTCLEGDCGALASSLDGDEV